MIKPVLPSLLLAMLAVFCSCPAGLASTVAYDNTMTPESGTLAPQGFLPFSKYMPNEFIGDEISLAGTERTVTEFSFILDSSVETLIPSLTVCFFRPDGLDANGSDGAPGSEIWTTVLSNVTVNGTTWIKISVPELCVPDSFIWAASADSKVAGLATYSPPAIGSSWDYYWNRANDDGLWYAMWFEQNPIANFAAKVVVTPEPTILCMFAVGLIPGLCRARKRSC